MHSSFYKMLFNDTKEAMVLALADVRRCPVHLHIMAAIPYRQTHAFAFSLSVAGTSTCRCRRWLGTEEAEGLTIRLSVAEAAG